jgi:hypothetical protein
MYFEGMSKEKTKKGPGRPRRKFTKAEVAKIDHAASLNCKDGTIAKLIDCDVTVMLDQFAKRIRLKRAKYAEYLRQCQYDHAAKTPAMAIFLGKNDLGQADKQEIQHGGNVIIGPPEVH